MRVLAARLVSSVPSENTFFGSDEAPQSLASQAALKNMEAAETVNRVAEKLSNLKIGISSDTTLFTGQIMEEVARQSSRQ